MRRTLSGVVWGILSFAAGPAWAAAPSGGEASLLHLTARFVLSLGAVLLAAKIGGEICERAFKQPAVLGELCSGILIGPYALGPWLRLPFFGPLFPSPAAATPVPVPIELYAFAQLAAVILLFMAGLETDLRQFLRFGLKAALVAIGGVLLPFFLGAAATVALGQAHSLLDPTALFIGAILTATSVGITARVLTDLNKLDTPEGVTIVGAAVIDDVLGILVLAVVVAISRIEGQGGTIDVAAIAWIGLRAVGFWLGISAAGLLLAPWIEKGLRALKTEGAAVALALAFCFLVSAATEAFGLAMIIGAYAAGLAMGRTALAEEIRRSLKPIYLFTVPVFFCAMGMLVDLAAMSRVLLFGGAITLLAIAGKIFGCGLPALASGFNRLGASRIGMGMLPRGEVALIVAGVGLTSGVINGEVFGVSIMMTFLTTLLAPIFLVKLFRNPQSGLRRGA